LSRSMNDPSSFEAFAFALGRRRAAFADSLVLSHLLASLRNTHQESQHVCEEIVGLYPEQADSPHARALLMIAEEADRSGRDNSYHNPAHSLEVGVIWLTLAMLGQEDAPATFGVHFEPDDLLLGCCAAFGHDILHDGRGNEIADPSGVMVYQPFRLELRAADCVGAILRRNHVDEPAIEAVRCAILLTDIVQGYPVLEASLRPNFDVARCSQLRQEFSALRRPSVRLMAAILRDADVLQSAGLTASDHDRQTAALEAEKGLIPHALGADGAKTFFEDILGGHFLSPGGQAFQRNMDELRALNERRRTDRNCAGLALEAVAERIRPPSR
jgi:hypothetical protein